MTYEEAKDSIALGRYRHFKGKEYEVLAIARHSETKEPMVVYRALYNSDIYGDGAVQHLCGMKKSSGTGRNSSGLRNSRSLACPGGKSQAAFSPSSRIKKTAKTL